MGMEQGLYSLMMDSGLSEVIYALENSTLPLDLVNSEELLL